MSDLPTTPSTATPPTRVLVILVGKLRNKLGDDASAPRYTATEPGVGLRFIAQSGHAQ